MNSKQRYAFNIFFLMVAVLWPLFKALYFDGIDGAGRTEIILMLLALFINGKVLFNTPKVMHTWLLWIIYCTINLYFKGFYSETNTFSNWIITRLIFPYMCMLVSYQAFKQHFTNSTERFFYAYATYVVLGAFATKSIESYDVGVRMSNELGNAFFNTAILLGLFASLMYAAQRIDKWFYWIVVATLMYVILLSGERKGFIAFFVIMFGSLLGVNMKTKKNSLLSFLVIIGLAFLLVNVAVSYSTFGERMSNSMETSMFEDNLFLKLMGDRGVMYFEGWGLFLQNLCFGIGLNKYGLYNSFMDGLPFHTEYMVQLCECGLVGTSMFLVFYWGMIKRLFRLLKHDSDRTMTIIVSSAFLAIIVINFVAWTYDNPNYFMVYGLIYAYFDKKQSLQLTRI